MIGSKAAAACVLTKLCVQETYHEGRPEPLQGG